MEKFSYLKSVNADYIDEVYQQYLSSPHSVEESWRFFFEGIELGAELSDTNDGAITAAPATVGASADVEFELKAYRLMQAYRAEGYLEAAYNPLENPNTNAAPLALATYGLSAQDLGKTVQIAKAVGLQPTTLKNVIDHLRSIYCHSTGVEIAHVRNTTERSWLEKKIESSKLRPSLNNDSKKRIYERLAQAESFEKFLHTRYVAQKRFSVEGGEAIIPALDCVFETAAESGAKEFVLGMAHRGRLNVLTNIFGKKAKMMFTEFEAKYATDLSKGEGDVKYHKGYSRDLKTPTGKEIHLSLTANPSHLEFVDAVVTGITRAKQDRRNDIEKKEVIAVAIHGDAALAGQGVCYEVMNFMSLEGYSTGGTIHFVINNQVGFTTPWTDSRSSRFCTDLALMLDCPVFHVNGDDVEAVWAVSQIAAEYRQTFKKDIFVDIVCYRKYGHNEGDEPTFTQPLMYGKIKSHATPREIYAKKLAAEGSLSEADSTAVVEKIMGDYQTAQAEAKAENPTPTTSVFEGAWKGYERATDLFVAAKTAVDAESLKKFAKVINTIPENFHLHPKLGRFLEARLKAVDEGKGLDWGNAESLAYASLLTEGHPVRITGQDAERGTFTHRHAVLTDSENAHKLCLLNHLSSGQARFRVHNSHLSETGVLGFEHGYSLAMPEGLTIWEAQFGDFANGAQVIIDQFIATSESKWNRMSGLTLLLPHGYEGQGPEHSSARLERFLQLYGLGNIFVANLTTPAQIFHALRRQAKWKFRKPLVIMSPKSLLRHPLAISSLSDLSEGGFQEVIDDSTVQANEAKRVLLCSGKVYYDLVSKRTELGRNDVAIVRIEQLAPLHEEKIAQILGRYKNAKDIVWVQEEPRNMGAWGYIFQMWSGGLSNLGEKCGGRAIRYVGRDIAASPAVGSPKVHEAQLKEFLEKAFQS